MLPTLAIYHARVTYKGLDRLDISRKGNDPVGVALAPSWELLKPLLALRRTGLEDPAAWAAYVDEYTEEMRHSYVTRRTDWDAILARGPELTLVCYCTGNRCHRTVAAELLVKVSRGAAFDAGPRTIIR